jgi:hypothetical protein
VRRAIVADMAAALEEAGAAFVTLAALRAPVAAAAQWRPGQVRRGAPEE